MTPFERPHPRPAPPGRPAFTLVELMISIALVALLILGVNQVFLYTSQAIGAGQAIGDAVRNARSVQTVLANDFAGIAPNGGNLNDSAFLTIYSAATPAFLNAADQAGDKDGKPLTIDLNGNGKEGDEDVPGENIGYATYNFRNHRLDMLGFFTRGNFQRQTGNDGTFVANMTAPEAFVSYGHLWLPDNNLAFSTAATPPVTYPAAGTSSTNPNNYYATQFVLGRMAMLLRPPTTAAPANYIYDNSGASPTSQAFVLATSSNGLTCPLFGTSTYELSGAGTTSTVPAGSTTTTLSTLNQSRFDLAGTSIKTIQAALEADLAAGGADTWWYNLMGQPSSATAGAPPARFQCNPFVPKPLTAAAMAQASPYFLRGCSQFIVEYAGDFVTQDNNVQFAASADPAYTPATVYYGDTVSAGPDGQLDYTLVPPAGVSPVPPRNQWRKQIKWYGLPRSTSGLGTINGANGDVIPLRDWIQDLAVVTKSSAPASFEKVVPSYLADYSTMASGQSYNVVFGPNDPAPKLIRITITLVDPTGRLPEGQTYQYVFPVPPQ